MLKYRICLFRPDSHNHRTDFFHILTSPHVAGMIVNGKWNGRRFQVGELSYHQSGCYNHYFLFQQQRINCYHIINYKQLAMAFLVLWDSKQKRSTVDRRPFAAFFNAQSGTRQLFYHDWRTMMRCCAVRFRNGQEVCGKDGTCLRCGPVLRYTLHQT